MNVVLLYKISLLQLIPINIQDTPTKHSLSDSLSHVFFRWMYWTDWEEDPKESKRGKIERAWMDGSNRNVFLTSKTVLWPNGLSLDIPQGVLYWVDAYYDRIEMVYLNSSERKVGARRRRDYFTVVRDGAADYSDRV